MQKIYKTLKFPENCMKYNIFYINFYVFNECKDF